MEIRYRGYRTRPEYSAEDHIFYGRIFGIGDMVYFQSDSAKDLEEEFHKAVDDYLEFCAEIGKIPQRDRNSMKMITVSELETNLEKYVEMAQIQDAFIVQNGKVVAKLTSAEHRKAPSR